MKTGCIVQNQASSLSLTQYPRTPDPHSPSSPVHVQVNVDRFVFFAPAGAVIATSGPARSMVVDAISDHSEVFPRLSYA